MNMRFRIVKKSNCSLAYQGVVEITKDTDEFKELKARYPYTQYIWTTLGKEEEI